MWRMQNRYQNHGIKRRLSSFFASLIMLIEVRSNVPVSTHCRSDVEKPLNNQPTTD